MTIAHTWRAALSGQACQECRGGGFIPERAAVWVLVVAGAMSGEELLCAECAYWLARHNRGFDAPPISTVGAEASAQTSEALAGINSEGLSTNTGINCDEQS